MIWNEVICLGDSLTYGARDEYGRSFPAELGGMLGAQTDSFWFCHNHGVNGDTSSDVLRRAWSTCRAHPEAKIMTLLVGTNDTKIPTPPEIYRDSVSQVVNAAQVNDKKVILGLLPPLEFSPFYISNRSYIDVYNQNIREIADETESLLCDLSSLGDDLIDGVHFDHAGYVKMAELWAAAILSM